MKPFNLERALAGDPVIAVWTGRNKVSEIHVFKKSGSIGFVIEGKSNVCSCDLEGKQGLNPVLFMAAKKETWWFVRDTQAQEVIDAKTGVVIQHKLFQSGLYKGDRGKDSLLSQYGTRIVANQKVLLSIEIEE